MPLCLWYFCQLIVNPFLILGIHLLGIHFISNSFYSFPSSQSQRFFVPHHSASHCLPRSQTERPFPTAGNQKTRSIGLWKRRRLGSTCLPPRLSRQSAGPPIGIGSKRRERHVLRGSIAVRSGGTTIVKVPPYPSGLRTGGRWCGPFDGEVQATGFRLLECEWTRLVIVPLGEARFFRNIRIIRSSVEEERPQT